MRRSLIRQYFKAFQQILIIANVEKISFWHSLIMVKGKVIPLHNVINAGQGLPRVFASMACINRVDVTGISALANTRDHRSLRCRHGFCSSSEAARLEHSVCFPSQVSCFGAGCLGSQASLFREYFLSSSAGKNVWGRLFLAAKFEEICNYLWY